MVRANDIAHDDDHDYRFFSHYVCAQYFLNYQYAPIFNVGVRKNILTSSNSFTRKSQHFLFQQNT